MASYDNLMAEQPWSFRPAFSDAWFSDVLTKETETLTKALQTSLAGASFSGDVNFSAEMMESVFSKPDTTPVQTPTASGVSENDAVVTKQSRSLPPRGRIAKRKPRASKRAATTTTFIAADPEHFMQMVQQVTGLRLGGLKEQLQVAPLSGPAPHRAIIATDGLPTLDTSAFLLDGSASSYMASPPSAAVADGGVAASEHYFDSSFCSFPTLESWDAVE